MIDIAEYRALLARGDIHNDPDSDDFEHCPTVPRPQFQKQKKGASRGRFTSKKRPASSPENYDAPHGDLPDPSTKRR